MSSRTPKGAPEAGADADEGDQPVPATAVARRANQRELDDPQVMRALAHPTRIALLEALAREGPLTATQAAALLDDSPGSMSWHFQTLAKYGFVEDSGTGRGRTRPWRLVSLGTRYSPPVSDVELSTAGDILDSTYLARVFDRLQEWVAERATFAPEWRQASFSDLAIVYLTPEELEEVGEEILAIVQRHRHRTYDRAERPAGATPVHLFATGHPLRPTPSGN